MSNKFPTVVHFITKVSSVNWIRAVCRRAICRKGIFQFFWGNILVPNFLIKKKIFLLFKGPAGLGYGKVAPKGDILPSNSFQNY